MRRRPKPTDLSQQRSRRGDRSSSHEPTAPNPRAEPVFHDHETGETGTMHQRGDGVFAFHPHAGGPARGVTEPGRYARVRS